MKETPSRLRSYLALGRVSNLPTVWTNVLTGFVLSRAPFTTAVTVRITVALSLFYVAGMFLNDAFDRNVDRAERPERPIPSGVVSATEVFAVGFGLLLAGIGLVAWNRAALGQSSFASLVSAVVLAGLIVLYDVWHQKNPLAPVVMGLCRGAIYFTAGLAAGGFAGPTLVWGAASLAGYTVGLTFVARQENRKSYRAGATLGLLSMPGTVVMVAPGRLPVLVALMIAASWVVVSVVPLFGKGPVDVRRSVVRLIAGISLVDGVFVAILEPRLSVACGLGFLATLGLQRLVSGT